MKKKKDLRNEMVTCEKCKGKGKRKINYFALFSILLFLGIFIFSTAKADNFLFKIPAINKYTITNSSDSFLQLSQGFNILSDVNISKFSMTGLLTTGMMVMCVGTLQKEDGSFIANLNFGMTPPNNNTNITFRDDMGMPFSYVTLSANFNQNAYFITAACYGDMGSMWGFDDNVYGSGNAIINYINSPTNDTGLIFWEYVEPPLPPPTYVFVDWGTQPEQPLFVNVSDEIPVDLKCVSSTDLMMGTIKLYANFSGWTTNITQSNPTNNSFYNWTVTGAPIGIWLLGGYCETDIWGMGPTNITATNRTVVVLGGEPPITTTIPVSMVKEKTIETGDFISKIREPTGNFLLGIGLVAGFLILVYVIFMGIGDFALNNLNRKL